MVVGDAAEKDDAKVNDRRKRREEREREYKAGLIGLGDVGFRICRRMRVQPARPGQVGACPMANWQTNSSTNYQYPPDEEACRWSK